MTWDALLPRNAARLLRDSGGRIGSVAPSAVEVTFSFFAPRNPAVNLVGDFTTWVPEPMQSDERGWWRAERRLTDGVYQYRFQVQLVNRPVDEWVHVTDLRSPCVPTDKTANRICIASGQIRRDDYVWRHDDAPLPLNEDLASVCLTPDSPWFQGAAPSCEAVLDALDDILATGARAIVVPPADTLPGLGHDMGQPFFPSSECREAGSFKRMVDECHRRGVRVIVEMECGQGDVNGTLARIDHDYWYTTAARMDGHAGTPRFDYERHDERLGVFPAQEFMRACVFHWIDTYHIDGIRFVGAKSPADRAFLAQLGAEACARATLKPFLIEVK